MTKEQVIFNFVNSVFEISQISVSREYFTELVKIAVENDGVLADCAIGEIAHFCRYSSNNIALSKIAMLKKMIN
jgi:hypothetical protein